MIAQYTRPQTEIQQRLEVTPNALLDRIHAVVVGPAYLHADADADNLVFRVYQEGDELPYAMLRNDLVVNVGAEVVDQEAAHIVAKNLQLVLFEAKAGFTALPTDPTGSIVYYASGLVDTEDSGVAENFDGGRFPAPGDLYRFTSNTGAVIERRVTGLLGEDSVGDQGDTLYTGALGDGSAAADAVEVSFANFPSANQTVELAVAPGTAIRLYSRRFGAVGLGDREGLRLNVEVTCTSGAGAVAGSTFTATVNGVNYSPTVAAISSTGTKFTWSDMDISLTAYKAWATNDRVVFLVDLDFVPDVTVFDTAIDFTSYTYEDSNKRKASTILIDVLSLSDENEPTVRISDTYGLMTPLTAVLTDTTNDLTLEYDGVELDFSVTLDAEALLSFHVGQRYALSVIPPARSTTAFDKVTLSAPLGAVGSAASFTVTALYPFSGSLHATEEILATANFTTSTTLVTLVSLAHAVPGYTSETDSVRFAEDGKGTVAVQWRAIIPVGITEGLIAIDSADDILTNFYSYQRGSELGYGLAKAFGGSQGKRVYALNTGGHEVEHFQAAFDKLEAAWSVYAIAVLTEDEEIMQLAAQHAQNMSASTVKKFRRIYVGTDSPGEYPILGLQAEDDTPFTATVEAGTGGGYTLVTFQQSELDLSEYTITRGDKLLIIGSGEEYPIDYVTETSPEDNIRDIRTLVLQSGPAYPVGETAVQIMAADTPENTARFVYRRSARLGANVEEDRRISNIWTHEGRIDNVLVPNRFGACEIAGIRTALQPQQGLTRTEVSFIDSSPAMYTQFKPTLLDTMAANGVWIIAQNSAEGPCYVRHQLTTAVSSGSLYYEDNAGVNMDTVCFAMDDICEPMIGKRNATPRTVIEIKNKLCSMLTDLTHDIYDSELGPQLIAYYNLSGAPDTMDVAINKNFKDRIDVAVIIEIPLPLNNIKIVVLGRTIKSEGIVTTSLSYNVVRA